jgi:hypothetical protein
VAQLVSWCDPLGARISLRSALRAGLLTLLLALLVPGSALGAPSLKKSIWGPVEAGGQSPFPVYADLGVGIYQYTLDWPTIAPTRPAQPRDPSDPAYRWPAELDVAIREAKRRGIRVSVLLNHAPSWANGGRPQHWAPTPRSMADFAAAAVKRYPHVRHWMIWGEPSKTARFQPLRRATGRRLTRAQRRGPRLYARILDAAYRAVKRTNRRDLVIGGNTWSGGEVAPLNFLKAMRLPSGRRPRMDLYGHNPFTLRLPNLRKGPTGYGFADFSELDALARWLDRLGYRTRKGRKLRLFLSEFTLPTDHANHEFNFWVTRETQAKWIRAALRITRRWRRIHTFGYLGLYDDPPRRDGLEVNRGLIDRSGRKKPAYRAFKRG